MRKVIPNFHKLNDQALEIALKTVSKLEARHILVWWLSSYENKVEKGLGNETVQLTPFQVSEFRFSYKISNDVSRFFLIIQKENWFFNDLGFSSVSIDENGVVLNIDAIEDALFSIFINKMSIRINFADHHKEKLIHAKKYAKEVILVKCCAKTNTLLSIGETIPTKDSLSQPKSQQKKRGAI